MDLHGVGQIIEDFIQSELPENIAFFVHARDFKVGLKYMEIIMLRIKMNITKIGRKIGLNPLGGQFKMMFKTFKCLQFVLVDMYTR